MSDSFPIGVYFWFDYELLFPNVRFSYCGSQKVRFDIFLHLAKKNKFVFKRLDMSNFIFRDTGIVIQISILQWVVEVFQISVYLFYMFNYRGKSHEMDKFFSLYMLAFTIIVIPLFYLNGDLKFRTDLTNSGYITALKNALKWIKDKPMKTIE